MSEKLSPKRQLILMLIVAVVGFVLLLIYQQEILRDTWQTLKGVDIKFMLLLPFIQIINYFFIGTYYRKMFELFGAKIDVVRSWGVVAAMNFVNQILPSGGLSGITYLAYGFRMKIETGKTTLIQIGRYMFAFMAYALLLPVSVYLIVVGGRSEILDSLVEEASNNWAALAVVAIFLLLLGLVIGSFINKWVAHATGRMLLRFLNWFNRKILRRSNHIELNIVKQLNREFHQGTDLIKQQGFKSLRPAVFMFLSAMTEILIVYVSLLAVGGDVGMGPVFLAFVAANVVGTVSVIPGDVGVHEATVILVLVAFGAPEPVAISTTLMYRVFNKVIFLPIGFYFYARILKPALESKSDLAKLKS